jgi:4-hydroxymandelate oxidase
VEQRAAAAVWDTQDMYVTLREIEAAARLVLTSEAWDFVEGGSGDEWTLRRNRAAFLDWRFRPRVLAGVDPPATTTNFLGRDLAMPLVVAPFGFDGVFHPEGFEAVVHGGREAGTAVIVPAISCRTIEDVAASAPDVPKLFQPIAGGADETFLEQVGRAEAAGYIGLVVTVDTSMPGWRERSMERRWNPDPSLLLANFGGDIAKLGGVLDFSRRTWTWEHLGELCASVSIPWLAKGVLVADDARAAVDAGAAGVFVSNHGGRQLDGAPGTLDALPEIVEAIGADAIVGIDGGIRRGSDVVKALALGADVVAVGRPVVWGLAAAGASGVHRVLDLLRQELVTTMSLCGLESISAISRALVEPSPDAGRHQPCSTS